jgi:hypothetical protein
VVVAGLIVLVQLLAVLVDQVVAVLMVVLVVLEQWDKDLLAERQPLQTLAEVEVAQVT